jgi:hypothetical protein
MTEETRGQIWAEAVSLYELGEDSYLDRETEKMAQEAQLDALEYDEREGKVLEYLDTLLPEDWYSMSIQERVDYFQNTDDPLAVRPEGVMRREKVCSTELWMECFGRSERSMTRQDSNDMAGIMARIRGWNRTGERIRIPGYGQQRPFLRV